MAEKHMKFFIDKSFFAKPDYKGFGFGCQSKINLMILWGKYLAEKVGREKEERGCHGSKSGS